MFNGGSTEVRPLGTPSKCGGSACRSISAHGAAASLGSSAITTSVPAFAANNVAANTKLPGSVRNSFADLSSVPLAYGWKQVTPVHALTCRLLPRQVNCPLSNEGASVSVATKLRCPLLCSAKLKCHLAASEGAWAGAAETSRSQRRRPRRAGRVRDFSP